MTDQNQASTYPLADDDKLTPAMFYTNHGIIWGQVFSKQAIRVSTWLLTDMVPSYIKIIEAQQLLIGGSQTQAPIKTPILYLQINNINAYHLMPPVEEPVDYDPNEPNRKMVPTTGFIGYFRFDGFSRMADFTNMDNYLGAAKADFIPLYDSKMTCPLVASIKGIQAPMVLLRQERVIFHLAET